MEALPALVRAMRYGDVRATDTDAPRRWSTRCWSRIAPGCRRAVTGWATTRRSSCATEVEESTRRWRCTRSRRRVSPGPVARDPGPARRRARPARAARRPARPAAGRRARCSPREDAARRLQRRTSVGVTPAEKAAWVEGFLAGSGLLLVHDRPLLAVARRLAGRAAARGVRRRAARCCGGRSASSSRPSGGRSAHQLAAARRRRDGRAVGDRVVRCRRRAGGRRRGPSPGSWGRRSERRRMSAERRPALAADARRGLGGRARGSRRTGDDDGGWTRRWPRSTAPVASRRRHGDRRGAPVSGASAPTVARWLGDIRDLLPGPVVQVMQRDAIERLGPPALLLEPELMESLEPDVHLVATLHQPRLGDPARRPRRPRGRSSARWSTTSSGGSPHRTRAGRDRRAQPRGPHPPAEAARHRLEPHDPRQPQALPARAAHRRPRSGWSATGAASSASQRDIILAIDQSGSMAASVVYASIFGAVIASLRAVRTSLVVFDTAVVDLTEELSDPVDLLFGTQLGGGTDINRALAYCQALSPARATPCSSSSPTCSRAASATRCWRGSTQLRATPGSSWWSCSRCRTRARRRTTATRWPHLAELGVPAFACTPDAFPDLLAVAIDGGDVGGWAHRTQADRRYAVTTPHSCTSQRAPARHQMTASSLREWRSPLR